MSKRFSQSVEMLLPSISPGSNKFYKKQTNLKTPLAYVIKFQLEILTIKIFKKLVLSL